MNTISTERLKELARKSSVIVEVDGIFQGISVTSELLHALTTELISRRSTEDGKADGRAPTHRHKKRGTEYVLIGIGKMQAESWHRLVGKHGSTDTAMYPADMREVAIYRSVDDGSLWVRPREEFEDGRFEALPAPTPAVEAEGVTDARLAMLDEIADGAWGDGPMTRGKARDEAARIRTDLTAALSTGEGREGE